MTLRPHIKAIGEVSLYGATSGVNGKLVYHISFCSGRNDEIRKKYLSIGY